MTGDIPLGGPHEWKRARPGLEWAKWLGFVLMLADHANTFLLDHRVPALFVVGRLVFPLFALALAEGVAGRGELRANDVLKRLLFWACVSQVPWSYFESAYALNVMFTLAAGMAVWLAVAGTGSPWKRAAWVVLASFVSVFAEYGLAGVVFVACVLWWREAPTSRWAMLSAIFASLLLYVPNHSWVPLLGIPCFLSLRYLGELPRARHWFYPMYAGQFVLFAFLAWKIT